MNPTRSILDPKFRWIPSAETDLRKTFARARREQQQLKQKQAPAIPTIPLRKKA